MKKDPEKAKELLEAAAAAKPTLTIKRMIRQLHVSFLLIKSYIYLSLTY